MPDEIALTINGQAARAQPGETVAVAVMRAHGWGVHRSVSGEPRGPLCGMGICYECRVTIDGQLHERSCMIPCRDGMEIRTDSAPVPPRGGA